MKKPLLLVSWDWRQFARSMSMNQKKKEKDFTMF